jgi:L-2-hydroxyglutarate oxidase
VETLTYSGFRKIAFKYWDTGLGEMKRSFFKGAYVKELKKLIPEIKSEDLVTGPSGVRAQLCDKNGELVDDFKFVDDVQAIHVLNAPSPAATSSLQIGETVCQRYEKMLS